MTINVSSLIKLAEFFLRTPTERADLDFADKTVALATKIAGLPEFAEWEASGEALIKAEGWTTTKDPATGHIATIEPPPVQDGVRGGSRGGLMAPGT